MPEIAPQIKADRGPATPLAAFVALILAADEDI